MSATANNALVIGGTRGIGLGIVKHALSYYPNATIFVTARDPHKATELKNLADSNNGRIQILKADVLDAASLQSVAKTIEQSSSSLDVAIYNAGVLIGLGNMLEVGIDALKENIDVNVYGAYYAAAAFSPLLLKSKFEKKTLVLITSSYGSMALSDQIASAHESAFGQGFDATAMYNISKTALNRLGKELDTILRRQGVPVLLVHPGLVKTDTNPYGDMNTDDSASGILKVLSNYKASKKNFVAWDGEELPW